MNPEEIKMMAEPNLDPRFCKITLTNQTLLPGKILNCSQKKDGEGSALLEAFFALEGVCKVMISENFLTFEKSTLGSWNELAKDIGGILRDFLSKEEPLFSEHQEKQMKSSSLEEETPRFTSPEALKIQEVIDMQINPAIASHGGRIILMDVKETTVYVRMDGGCQGCGMAKMTLKQGVETMIQQHFPHIQEVIDITDHTIGNNPYYQKH